MDDDIKRRRVEYVRAYQKRNIAKGFCMYGPHPALPGIQTCERHSGRTGRSRIIDMTGQRYGKLIALEMMPDRIGGHIYWRCRCDCGGERITKGILLRRGETTSCGCMGIEKIRRLKLTHGRCGTPEYITWTAMIGRCENGNLPEFANYGGRGIAVCSRWRHDFSAFLTDMGFRPSTKHEIDRIDNNGNYEPGNCRWALPATQNRNKRNNRWLTYNGETLCAKDWSTRTGVNYVTLLRRLRSGWSIESALINGKSSRRGPVRQP